MLYNTLRGETKLEDLKPLIEGGYCTAEEAEAVASKPEPFVPVLSWVASIAQDLCDTHGLLTPQQVQLVGSLLVDLRANAANVLLFVNTQLPYLAVQLFAVIVYAYLLQVGGGPRSRIQRRAEKLETH